MSDLKEMWNSHKMTIIAASVLILAVLMVGAVFLVPGLYVAGTFVGFLLILFGRELSHRTIQYMGILVVLIGIVGLTVLQVSSLTELGIVVAVLGVALLFFVENPRLRSRRNS